MGETSYLSIGQVLDLVKPEFPDLTISKIRFLESQGLLDPQRTPSGYRKFHDSDIERIRFILRAQQRDYLPLKVIKGRLGTGSRVASPLAEPAEPAEPARHDRRAQAAAAHHAQPAHPAAAPVAVDGRARPAGADSAIGADGPAGPAAADGPAGPAGEQRDDRPDVGEPVSLTIEELSTVSGLAPTDIAELERFGLVAGTRMAGTTYYDADSLQIARLAAGFKGFGVEARHLRMYRTAVEREAGLFGQVVTPMLKQRNATARRQVVDTLVELARLGDALRTVVLRQAMRPYTGGG